MFSDGNRNFFQPRPQQYRRRFDLPLSKLGPKSQAKNQSPKSLTLIHLRHHQAPVTAAVVTGSFVRYILSNWHLCVARCLIERQHDYGSLSPRCFSNQILTAKLATNQSKNYFCIILVYGNSDSDKKARKKKAAKKIIKRERKEEKRAAKLAKRAAETSKSTTSVPLSEPPSNEV